MNEIDAAVPSSAGGMLTRMVALARLSERIERHEPRRVLLDRIPRQMMLFSRMTHRLGVAAPKSTLMRAVLREAELGCLECANWRHCRQWLAGDYSYADIAFYMAQLFGARMTAPMTDAHPRLQAWRERMNARPAVAKVAGAMGRYLLSQGRKLPDFLARLST